MLILAKSILGLMLGFVLSLISAVTVTLSPTVPEMSSLSIEVSNCKIFASSVVSASLYNSLPL